jgi:eukaryotic-like serine/threonine-protein kinase
VNDKATPAASAGTDRLRRINALLQTALALPPERRADWLHQLTAEHAPLKGVLGALLARGAVETDTFLSAPLALSDAELLGPGPELDLAGNEVGPWRLISPLGQGGMAAVWLAERSDGQLHRQVALKLPHCGGVPGLAQRMQRERDILAALAHPNIARLYDAGTTAQGRPWLAMEHVQGLSIDRHCQQPQHSVTEVLRLFLQVTAAVADAHAHLVVHRDLKPNNILVTEAGEVRLLDFGVAKLLEQDSPVAGELTQLLGRALTPDYASPEQVSGRPVTVATDIYSLGVVLYELLTGQRPYRLQRSTMAALEEAIMAADVPLASRRVADQPRLARTLRGDLDNILSKALRKHSAQRYASVEAFAADIQRYLDGEPVLAQPRSRGYVIAKFVRRHRLAVGAFGAVGLSVLIGLGVALWQAGVARAEAARAEQVKQFIASIFKQARPRQGQGGVVTASDLLAAAAQRIESELTSNPRVASELGVMVAEGFNVLGEPAKSEAPLRTAVARGEQVYGRQHPTVLWAKVLLADSIDEQDPQAALRVLADVLPDARAGLPDTAQTLATALYLQSYSLAKGNRQDESIAALKEGIAVAERHLGPAHETTIRSLGLLANTYGRFGQRAEHLRVATQAMERAAMLPVKRPDSTLTAVERWYAEALRNNGRPADAIPILRRVVQDQRTLDAAETPRVRNALVQLAIALDGAGQQTEGLRLMREAVALEAVQNPKDSDDRLAFVGVLAAMLTAAGHIDEALTLNGRLIRIEQQLGNVSDLYMLDRKVREARGLALQGDHEGAARLAVAVAAEAGDDHVQQRAEAWIAGALNARLRGKPAQALTQALSDPKATGFRITVLAAAAAEEGLAWFELGEFAKAELALRKSLEQYSRAQVAPSPRMAPALIGMARIHLHAGHAAQAQALLKPLVLAWEEVNADSPWHGEALYWQARAQAAAGQADDARRSGAAAAALLGRSKLPALRRYL